MITVTRDGEGKDRQLTAPSITDVARVQDVAGEVFELKPCEVFSWIDPDTKEIFHFDVEGMRAYAEAGLPGVEKVRFPIEFEMAEMFLKDRFVDMEYVKNIIAKLESKFRQNGALDFTKEKALQPLLGIAMPDGTHLTVDGHHRLVLWTMLKLPEGLMEMFDYETAKMFMLDVPAEVNESIRLELSA